MSSQCQKEKKREKKKKTNRHDTQLIEESVVPDLLHVIPIVNYAVLYLLTTPCSIGYLSSSTPLP
jgi:hypothetical protein